MENVVCSKIEGLKQAEQLGLDLVEISAKSVPPICKIINYSKFLYDQKKKQKEIAHDSLSVREHGGNNLGMISREEFIDLIKIRIAKELETK